MANPNDRLLQAGFHREWSVPFAHPDYAYHREDWLQIRDCIEGEKALKRRQTYYLPRLDQMTQGEYADYLDRAAFYNMTGRTLNGLVGTIFRRQPKVLDLPPELEDPINRIGRDRSALNLLVKDTVREQLTTGRVGVLVDRSPLPSGEPYLAPYIAENIIDWDTVDIDGKVELRMVLLRELVLDEARSVNGSRIYRARYRQLILEFDEFYGDIIYKQRVFQEHTVTGAPNFQAPPDEEYIPVNRGVPFRRIPFRFFGPWSNGIGVERSPLMDIVNLNIHHYRTYAHLQHGRFYTGLPVYYAPVGDGSQRAEYRVGPGVVWEVAPGEKPGILEFNGHGLKSLENALDFFEQHISSLGGRMLGIRGQATSESDNQTKLKERNEQSLLLNATDAASAGFTDLVRIWAEWMDVPAAQVARIKVEVNQDFLFDAISAREFRAVAGMYQDGILPIEVLYDYFRRAELVPDYMTLEEFKTKLEDTDSFPMQPDAAARSRGYPDRKSELDQQDKEKDRRLETDLSKQAAQVARENAQNQPGQDDTA